MREKRIYIHDSTLREGHQSRHWNFSLEEKLFIAHVLKNIWVDSIEIWFWWASEEEDKEMEIIVEEIWKDENSPVIASLTGLSKKFVERTMFNLRNARKKRICLLTSGSDEHINVKFSSKWNLESDRKKVILELIKENTQLAVKNGFEVQLTTEDANSADREYLLESIIVAVTNGATYINLPDTLWKWTFWEIEELFKYIFTKTKFLRDKWYDFKLTTHHHNDMWLAVANNLWAIRWWAEAIETTLLWIWDRIWISSMEETVLNILERSKEIIVWENIILPRIQKELFWSSIEAMAKIIWVPLEPNKPLFWSNNNVHGAGIHNAANEKWKKTWIKKNIYEVLSLTDYGVVQSNYILSATGGRSEVVRVLWQYGIYLEKKDDIVKNVTKRYKREATITKWVYPAKIFVFYLEEIGEFILKDEDIKIVWNTVEISFLLQWKKIKITWKWGVKNGVVDATRNALKSFFRERGWDIKISVWKFSEKVRFSLSEIEKDFNKRLWKKYRIQSHYLKESNEKVGSKKITVVELTLKINGEEIFIKNAWHNAELSAIKWILYASLKEILNFKITKK